MSDDRARRAADEFAEDWGLASETRDHLAEMLTAARAEGAAMMREEAAGYVAWMIRSLVGDGRERIRDALALTEQGIRAMEPAGLVAVATEDLRHALNVCDCRPIHDETVLDPHTLAGGYTRVTWPKHHGAAVARVRATVSLPNGGS